MKRVVAAVALFLFAGFAAARSARAADAAPPPAPVTLTVTVLNVSDAGGQLDIGVYDEAGFKAKHGTPLAGRIVTARPGTMTVTIDAIPPGVYAVKMFQDVNRNGYFDFGIRLVEPYGFSNDPASPTPSFDDAKFALNAGSHAITVTLH
jgi:uncharacterized protein (DUF2141 family)